MDDARSRDPADPRKAAAAMMQQGIHQRAVEIPGRRMDDEACGLVDYEQVFILEHDFQRNVLRFVVRRRGFRNCDAETFVTADLRCRVAKEFARSLDGAASDQRFQSFARDCRCGIGKRTVEAPAGVSRLQANIDRLTTPHRKQYGLERRRFNPGSK